MKKRYVPQSVSTDREVNDEIDQKGGGGGCYMIDMEFVEVERESYISDIVEREGSGGSGLCIYEKRYFEGIRNGGLRDRALFEWLCGSSCCSCPLI